MTSKCGTESSAMWYPEHKGAVHMKCWQVSIRLHSSTSQKTQIILNTFTDASVTRQGFCTLRQTIMKSWGSKSYTPPTPLQKKPNNLIWTSSKLLLFETFNCDGKSPQNQTCSNIHIKIHVTCSLMLQQRNSKLKSQVATTTATVQSIQTFWKTKTVNCDIHSQHCGLFMFILSSVPVCHTSLPFNVTMNFLCLSISNCTVR